MYLDMIGKRVAKPSGKPFKSGLKVNTVKGVIDHPILHVPAFTFVEDESYVNCLYCGEVMEEAERKPTTMIEDGDGYRAEDGSLTLAREYDTKTPNDNPMAGRWVLRGKSGNLITFDQYRNNIAEQFHLEF